MFRLFSWTIVLTIITAFLFDQSSTVISDKIDYPFDRESQKNIQKLHSVYVIDITNNVEIERKTLNRVRFIFASGGKVVTTHAPQPSQVVKTINQNKLIAGIDGTFFGMNDPDSSQIIGPVLSNRSSSGFIPGTTKDIVRIKGRPLVLIGAASVKFLPFDPNQHNTLSGVTSELPSVTDVFVSGGWLVKKGKPQTATSFGNLYKVNEPRRRAFWGLNARSQPTLGISTTNIGAVKLGELLAKEGWKEAVMLDSGQSTSLAYKGKSLVNYTPRPVPHVVGLVQ
jgi:poly-beta-1,6-N-acetyl-D-glucosamine N-deacetylase